MLLTIKKLNEQTLSLQIRIMSEEKIDEKVVEDESFQEEEEVDEEEEEYLEQDRR